MDWVAYKQQKFTVLQTRKSEMKVQADSVSGENLAFCLIDSHLFTMPHIAERERVLSQASLK